MSGHSAHRLESLDTLRGIAIFMVIGFHASVAFHPAPWLQSIAKLGNQGVQLFFLISAITMCMMWRQRADEPQRGTRFYIRRFFRIAPLFWAALVFYQLWWRFTLQIPTAADGPSWAQIVVTALFLHGFAPDAINLVVPGGWSIAVEMSFYAVFPLLAARLSSPSRMLLFAFAAYLLIGVAATAWIERVYAPDQNFVYYSMLTQLPIFPLGMYVYATLMGRERCDIRWFVAVVFAWLTVAFVGKYVFDLNTRPFFWLQVALFGALISIVLERRLHVGLLSLMGTLSYSMYLFHFAIIDVVAMMAPREWRDGTPMYLSLFAATLVLTMVAAKISALSVERWSTGAARAVIARLGQRSVEPRLSTE